MTFDLFTCKGRQPEDTITIPTRTAEVSSIQDECEGELGFEIDEGTSLQAAYELSRV